MKLARAFADTWRQSGGLGLLLAWMYCAFFSCGLIPHPIIVRSSEHVWVWVGMGMVACALVNAALRARFSIAQSRIAGAAGALFAAVGSCCIWLAFAGSVWDTALSTIGGLLGGAGLVLMTIIWGQRLSGFEVSQLERTVPQAFIMAFALYFVLLSVKGAPFALACILMPVGSMVLAFHRVESWACPFESECACGPGKPLAATLGRQMRSMAPILLLYFLMWVQFSSFRLISSPAVVGDRFMHYLLPFTSAAAVALVLFLICMRTTRFLNYSLMYRWACPLMMLGCIVFLAGPNSWYDFRSVAYTANFVAMFGVQLTLWVVTPKTICRMGFNPVLAFCGFLAAEGAGVTVGLALALPAVGHEETLSLLPLALTGLIMFAAMSIGFKPEWFFAAKATNPLFAAKERVEGNVAIASERTASNAVGSAHGTASSETNGEHGTANPQAGSPANSQDALASLFDAQARQLQREFGLTERETQVCALLLAGRSRPYIRDELVISLNTVHTHAHNIFQKCEVKSQQELMSLPGKLGDASTARAR